MIGKRLRKNNPTIALNILYTKEKEILPAYTSKYNSTRAKQINLSIILNQEKEGLNHLAVRKLFALLRGITSNHKVDFYCLNCLHSVPNLNCPN